MQLSQMKTCGASECIYCCLGSYHLAHTQFSLIAQSPSQPPVWLPPGPLSRLAAFLCDAGPRLPLQWPVPQQQLSLRSMVSSGFHMTLTMYVFQLVDHAVYGRFSPYGCLQQSTILQEDPSLTKAWKKTIHVAVTGASGQISNHLLFMVSLEAITVRFHVSP